MAFLPDADIRSGSEDWGISAAFTRTNTDYPSPPYKADFLSRVAGEDPLDGDADTLTSELSPS